MNKKIYTLFFIAMSTAIIALGNETNLKEIVREMDRSCPVAINEWMKMEKVKYANKVVTMSYRVECGRLNFDALANNESIKKGLLDGYTNASDDYFIRLIDAIIGAGAKLCVAINDCDGRSISFLLITDELKNNRPGNNNDPDIVLQAYAETERTQVPRKISEGLISVGVALDSKYYTHIYSVDESLYSIQSLKDNASALKSSLIKQLNPNELILVPLKLSRRGLAYKYIGATSGDYITIFIETRELPIQDAPFDDMFSVKAIEIQLKAKVEAGKRVLPLVIDKGLVKTDLILDDNYYYHVFNCDEFEYDIDQMRRMDANKFKQSLIKHIDFRDSSIRKQLAWLKVTNRGLAYKYIGQTSGKSYTVYIEPNELPFDDYIDGDNTKFMDFEKQLKEMIRIESQLVPYELLTGVTVINIKLDDKNLIYVSRCDESLYNMDDLLEKKSLMKQSILNGFDYTDPYFIKQIQLLKATQRGLVYKYIGDNSGKTCIINIGSNEIKQL